MFSLLKSDKKLIKPAFFLLLAAAAFLCFSMSGAAAKGAERSFGDVVQFRLGGSTLSTSAVQGILDKRDAQGEDVRYTAWTQEKSAVIENYGLGGKSSFDRALCYYGDNNGVFNLIRDNGCALSPVTAFKVFGTTEGISGENVLINGELYVVEKLLYDESASVVYKAKEDKAGAAFDVLDVVIGKQNPVSVSEIQMNYNIRGDIVIYYREVISFLGLSFYIPDSFIPTRWSEFEFWSDTFKSYGNSVKYYFSMKTYAPDEVFRSYMIKTAVFGLLFWAAAIAIAVFGFKIIKERGIRIGVNSFKKHFEKI